MPKRTQPEDRVDHGAHAEQVGASPAPAAQPTAAQPAAASERWVAIAAVMGTHGVQGELRVKLYNPDSRLLLDSSEITLRQGQTLSRKRLQDARETGKGWLVRMGGVNSVEAAKALYGAELCVPRTALPALPPGEYYMTDLEGLRAIDRAGAEVGQVLGVREYPASQVLRVKLAAGVVEVPLVDPYLVEVDLSAGHLVLDLLDDLEIEKPRR